MNFTLSFVSYVLVVVVVVVLVPIVDCEWSEEEFQRFERDLSELADSYLPFEAHQSSAESQHSPDSKVTFLPLLLFWCSVRALPVAYPGGAWGLTTPSFSVLFLNSTISIIAMWCYILFEDKRFKFFCVKYPPLKISGYAHEHYCIVHF